MPAQKLLYRIKGCGCDCATMPADPCVPCGAGAVLEAQCRARSGTATLRGYNEFTSPSLPPKKYRRKSFGGSFHIERYELPGCSGPNIYHCDISFSGQNTIDDSGVETIGGSYVSHIGGGSIPDSVATLGCNAFFVGGSTNQVTTKTRNQFTPRAGVNSDGCVDYTSISYQNFGLTGFDQLSDEDTEEAAMGRALGAWSDWAAPYGTCCAGVEPRGALDFIFGFSQSEVRLRATGTPGALVNLDVTWTRRAFASAGAFAAYATESFQISVPLCDPVASPGCNVSDWYTLSVPNLHGWQTCYAGALVTSVVLP